VPSAEVQTRFKRFEKARKNDSPTKAEVEKIIQGIKQGNTG
jgi:hypothetical protein